MSRTIPQGDDCNVDIDHKKYSLHEWFMAALLEVIKRYFE